MPKNIVPKTADRGGILPIQAASRSFNGPFVKGESADRIIGNDGEVQPIAQPCPSIAMLA